MGILFQVDHLETERLLSEWRWLCPSKVFLVGRNAFGELFLSDKSGTVLWLNTTTGRLDKVADSESQFRDMAETAEKRAEWFAEPEMTSYAKLGLKPNSSQCIGFSVPAVFAQGGTPATAYIADLYEYVSFLGDLHRQISSLPDERNVRLVVNPPKPATQQIVQKLQSPQRS